MKKLLVVAIVLGVFTSSFSLGMQGTGTFPDQITKLSLEIGTEPHSPSKLL